LLLESEYCSIKPSKHTVQYDICDVLVYSEQISNLVIQVKSEYRVYPIIHPVHTQPGVSFIDTKVLKEIECCLYRIVAIIISMENVSYFKEENLDSSGYKS
jgi:hypothetical protein